MKRFSFQVHAAGSTYPREALAGATTFLTMCYIVVVQPAMMEAAGMDKGAVFTATCLASALATLLMAFLANYPIALAPGMGNNAYFAYVVVLGMGISWEAALGAVFISGILFILLAGVGFRERIMAAVPNSLKMATAAGIGLLIAFLGLQWGGLVASHPVTLITLGDFTQPATYVALFGLGVTVVLHAWKVRGALVAGIAAATLLGLWEGVVSQPQGVFSAPPSVSPTFLALDPLAALFGSGPVSVRGLLENGLFTVIFVLFILDLFGTVGTLIGVSTQAGLLKDGKLPRARQALLSDAFGTVGGALLGTSTVTSYVESASGAAEGGRTGAASFFTALLFLAALFLHPLVMVVGQGYEADWLGGAVLHPPVAGALILVGYLMAKNMSHIPWEDVTEGLPAFLCMLVIPLSFNITEGIAVGFIAYSVLKVLTGRRKEAHPLVHGFAVLFVLRYCFGLTG